MIKVCQQCKNTLITHEYIELLMQFGQQCLSRRGHDHRPKSTKSKKYKRIVVQFIYWITQTLTTYTSLLDQQCCVLDLTHTVETAAVQLFPHFDRQSSNYMTDYVIDAKSLRVWVRYFLRSTNTKTDRF